MLPRYTMIDVVSAMSRGIQSVAYENGLKEGIKIGQEGLKGAITGILDDEIDSLIDQQSVLNKAHAYKQAQIWDDLIKRLDNMRSRIQSLHSTI